MIKSTEGDAETQLYTEVGRALTSWGNLELGLCELLQATLNPDSYNQAYKMFWSVVAFYAKLEIVDSSISCLLSAACCNKELEEWISHKEKLNRLNNKRNKIAHGSVVFIERKILPSEAFFVPFAQAGYQVTTTKGKSIPHGALRRNDLVEIRKNFEERYELIEEFKFRIRDLRLHLKLG